MKDSIIPYLIVRTLAKIDNIFEMRLFGCIFAKAQSVLKLYNKDLSQINLQHAMSMVRVTMPARYLLQLGDNNYQHIEKAFDLAQKWVDYEKDGWKYKLNIIAFPQIQKEGGNKYISFVIHDNLWHALLDMSKGYRLINLPTYMKLRSTYSVIMYILISQQKYSIDYRTDTLKELLGADRMKAYERTFNFINKCLKPAQKELNEVSPYTFDFKCKRSGRGGVITTITIIPMQNKAYKPPTEPDPREKVLDKQRIRLHPEVVNYLENVIGMDIKGIEALEGIILQMGDYDQQIRQIAEYKDAARRHGISNLAGYVTNCIKTQV